MSVPFIKSRENAKYIREAQKQSKDLSYFVASNLQEELTIEYLKQWANRKFVGSDKFLNWVKMIFKTNNFMTFYKYLRFPLVSAKLVNDEIKPQLQRVFYAEDSVNKIIVSGKEVEFPEELQDEHYRKAFFDAILFRHNDVVVHDLDNINEAYREIISIDSIVSVQSECGKIKQIAYLSTWESPEGVCIQGYSYINESEYIFYDLDFNAKAVAPHDLKECPADWISSENFSHTNDVVKKSIFSYVKVDMEELVFLKTLQRMTEPNGAIPVTTMLKTKIETRDGNDAKGISDNEPMASNTIGGQQATLTGEVTREENQLQTGTTVRVPMIKKDDGSIDMDVVKNYFQFHYIPVESLKYLNERINELESGIIISVLGDYNEQNTAAKNELQVSKSYKNREDNLRWVSKELSRIKTLSDFKQLALQHGRDNVHVEEFFGSDFFAETETELYDKFKIAPNPIERRSILLRSSEIRNKFNKNKAEREKILYKLIPYVADADFDKAITKGVLPNEIFELQTRFDYWIAKFESEYGEIQVFWNSLEIKESEKLILINNLIKKIITDESTASSTPANI